MAVQFIGRAVSIDCGTHGVYQGLVSSYDSAFLTIAKAFKDGKPCVPGVVSLLVAQITDLSFIEPLSDASLPPYVEPTPQISSHIDKNELAQSAKVAKVKAGAPEQPKQRRRSNSCSSERIKDDTQSPRRDYRNEHRVEKRQSCFSISVDKMKGEFDFEGNLAMFDKQKVFTEIETQNGKSSYRNTPPRQDEKFRHDEMIIKSSKARRQIQLINNDQEVPIQNTFETDDGLTIPSITSETRHKLFERAESLGFSVQRRIDMIGRNVCDMVIHLVGGGNRLNTSNSHQSPHVLILAASHVQGCYGINLARQLANHNIKVYLFVASCMKMSPLIEQEIAFYKLTGQTYITSTNDLPTKTLDLLVNCIDNEETYPLFSSQSWHKYLANWCNTSRVPILAIDPYLESSSIDAKWNIEIGLPLTGNYKGSVYLCDIGLPRQLFTHIGLKYRSPFGAKFCIPLQKKAL